MKKWLILFICLLASSAWSQTYYYDGADWSTEVTCYEYSGADWVECSPFRYTGSDWSEIGGLSCTTSDDSTIVDYSDTSTTVMTSLVVATKFTLGSNWRLTAYKPNLCDNSGDTADIALHIFTNDAAGNSGNGEPDAEYATDDTTVTSPADPFDACNTPSEEELALGTPVDIPSGTYWVVMEVTTGGASAIKWAYSNMGTRWCNSSTGTSGPWTCGAGNYSVELLGCTE